MLKEIKAKERMPRYKYIKHLFVTVAKVTI